MLTIQHQITKEQLPDLALETSDMVFDIETTGFSPKHACIYMIGILYPSEDSYILEQWFREKDSDEYEILFRFNQRLSDTGKLYSFNGDQFDLNFISKRMTLYGMTLNDIDSIDLLKKMRPFKKLLQLENLKLKTVEAYFGYERNDPFTGGDLITLYKTYLDTREDSLFKTLLLHNYEDLLGLGRLIAHMSLIDLISAFKNATIPVELTESTIENGLYRASFQAKSTHIRSLTTDLFQLKITGSHIVLTMPANVETLKLFFDTPSDYYYLPNEDYAVHKSIGKFVHKDHRIKATRDNCYVKKEDFFLPGYRSFELPLHLYYRHAKDPVGYYAVQDLIESGLWNDYISKLLTTL